MQEGERGPYLGMTLVLARQASPEEQPSPKWVLEALSTLKRLFRSGMQAVLVLELAQKGIIRLEFSATEAATRVEHTSSRAVHEERYARAVLEERRREETYAKHLRKELQKKADQHPIYDRVFSNVSDEFVYVKRPKADYSWFGLEHVVRKLPIVSFRDVCIGCKCSSEDAELGSCVGMTLDDRFLRAEHYEVKAGTLLDVWKKPKTKELCLVTQHTARHNIETLRLVAHPVPQIRLSRLLDMLKGRRGEIITYGHFDGTPDPEILNSDGGLWFPITAIELWSG